MTHESSHPSHFIDPDGLCQTMITNARSSYRLRQIRLAYDKAEALRESERLAAETEEKLRDNGHK